MDIFSKIMGERVPSLKKKWGRRSPRVRVPLTAAPQLFQFGVCPMKLSLPSMSNMQENY